MRGNQTIYFSYFQNLIFAPLAELADAHGSGPCESNFMGVQVSQGAPKSKKIRTLYQMVEGSDFYYIFTIKIL